MGAGLALLIYGTVGRDIYLNGQGKAYNAIIGVRVNL